MNEKATGKRFHWNIIDLLVLLLLAAIVVLVVVKLVSAGTQKAADPGTEPASISGPPAEFEANLRFECLAEGVESELARRIAENPVNRIYNGYKLCDGYIVKIVTEPCYLTLAGENGTALQIEDPDRVNLRFTVEAVVRDSDPYSSISGNFNAILGSQEIRVGKAYTLKSMAIELQTTITALEAPIHD